MIAELQLKPAEPEAGAAHPQRLLPGHRQVPLQHLAGAGETAEHERNPVEPLPAAHAQPATANTSPPPPSCSCASSASPPAMRSAMPCTKPPAGNTSSARATPTPGAWCGTRPAGPGRTSTPPRPPGSRPRPAGPRRCSSSRTAGRGWCLSSPSSAGAKPTCANTSSGRWRPSWRCCSTRSSFAAGAGGNAPEPGTPGAAALWPGLDSEFYQIEKRLAARGARAPAERAALRLAPARQRRPGAGRTQDRLRDLLHLHYRYRFDPDGLSQGDREALRREATGCLVRMYCRFGNGGAPLARYRKWDRRMRTGGYRTKIALVYAEVIRARTRATSLGVGGQLKIGLRTHRLDGLYHRFHPS